MSSVSCIYRCHPRFFFFLALRVNRIGFWHFHRRLCLLMYASDYGLIVLFLLARILSRKCQSKKGRYQIMWLEKEKDIIPRAIHDLKATMSPSQPPVTLPRNLQFHSSPKGSLISFLARGGYE